MVFSMCKSCCKQSVGCRQVTGFLARLNKATSTGKTLFQLSSKYNQIVHEEIGPMTSPLDIAGFFRVRLLFSFPCLISLRVSLPLSYLPPSVPVFLPTVWPCLLDCIVLPLVSDVSSGHTVHQLVVATG